VKSGRSEPHIIYMVCAPFTAIHFLYKYSPDWP